MLSTWKVMSSVAVGWQLSNSCEQHPPQRSTRVHGG